MPPRKAATPKSKAKKSDMDDSGSDFEEANSKPTPKRKTATKATGDAKTTDKGTKKVFDKPGQKKETPDELDVLRLYYESAYLENPKSEMAARWCLIHGLLPDDVAEEMVKQDAMKKPTTARKATSNSNATRKKTMHDSDSDEPPARKRTPAKKSTTPKRVAPVRKRARRLDSSEEESSSSEESSSEEVVQLPKTTARSRAKTRQLDDDDDDE